MDGMIPCVIFGELASLLLFLKLSQVQEPMLQSNEVEPTGNQLLPENWGRCGG